jgi:hypothetical protein
MAEQHDGGAGVPPAAATTADPRATTADPQAAPPGPTPGTDAA